uniref:CCHC-type domain-containing protein n=1 Tax=Tanacetum cinerariifolium TaxID=118510 RepID=A0A699I140_TANCI|nr:hypothetical protein [Tanacetum cinerariifolium]
MCEKPDIQAQIWKNQRSVHGQAKVKSWKLLESCGVQIITLTTTQLILLLERKYPHTKFTLNQILNNVQLEVEEESEVSLELLRFTRNQQQEDTNGMIKVLPLKIAKEVVAKERGKKARTILLMALPEDHLANSIRWLMQRRCEKLSNLDLVVYIKARAKGNAAGHNGNQIRYYNCKGVGHFARKCTVRPRRRDVAYLQTQLLIAQKEEAGIQLQAEEFDLMAAAADLDEIEEVNANFILMGNLQQASTSSTQTDKSLVYDLDGSAEVHNYKDCYDNDIFNMFTQKEQYTELLEPIPESHQVPQNDNNVISEVTSVEQSGGQ